MRIALLIFTLMLFSCENENELKVTPEVDAEDKWSNQHSMDFNQEIHIREELDIQIYLEHHKDLRMSQTNSGLRYQIANREAATGPKAGDGDLVTVDIEISLLDGRICYETDSLPDRFVLGKSDKETGLQEGLELMRLHDKARLILPSYLAHGLLGDSQTIPPQSVVIIDVELLNIEK